MLGIGRISTDGVEVVAELTVLLTTVVSNSVDVLLTVLVTV